MNEQQNPTQFNNQANNVFPVPANWNMPTAQMAGMMPPWLYFQNAGNNNNQRPMNTNPWFMNAQPQTPAATPTDPHPVETPDLTTARPVVSCGIISGQDEIKPADIPMDGGFGMFMEKDLSAIYIKKWQSDGKIHTKKFVEVEEEPEEVVVPTAPSEEMMSQINARFQRLEEYLGNLNRRMDDYISEKALPPAPPTPRKPTTKKDGGSSK